MQKEAAKERKASSQRKTSSPRSASITPQISHNNLLEHKARRCQLKDEEVVELKSDGNIDQWLNSENHIPCPPDGKKII